VVSGLLAQHMQIALHVDRHAVCVCACDDPDWGLYTMHKRSCVLLKQHHSIV
jgi:hypothetical protein